jgi:acid ceramidase
VIPEIDVDLDLPPARRWECLAQWRDSARALLRFYIRDMGGIAAFGPLLSSYRDGFVEPEYLEEMRGVARVLDAPDDEVVLANLYYDAMKLILSSSGFACTGFVVDTPAGPLHARNLDWMTADNLLATETQVVTFHRGGAPLYRTVGWPGFIGCFSGLAPGRFGITLNAVASDDPPELAAPIALVLRRVLETAPTFDDAVAALRDTPLVGDALLLVSGVHEGQMAVVERAPPRPAGRGPHPGLNDATNH